MKIEFDLTSQQALRVFRSSFGFGMDIPPITNANQQLKDSMIKIVKDHVHTFERIEKLDSTDLTPDDFVPTVTVAD